VSDVVIITSKGELIMSQRVNPENKQNPWGDSLPKFALEVRGKNDRSF
jgi:hypothetical protein